MGTRTMLSRQPVDTCDARHQMAYVLIWAAIWICGVPGAVLVLVALALARVDLLALATMMMVMVEDLLVSARADIGKISIKPTKVFLRAQAETALAGLGTTSPKEIEVVGDRGKVWGDPTRTRQIIRNLITNAVRYGGDRVVIEAVEGDEDTVLTVTDDGPGLDQPHWETIFEPYQRAHEPTTQPASIGLGLTVSRQLARMMGGDLTYEWDDRGSVFSLLLLSEPEERRAEGVVAGPELVRTDVG